VAQAETHFGELEYIESQLKALSIVELGDAMIYIANEKADLV
jgi:hypothetical protein